MGTGKTPLPGWREDLSWKHPRGDGEDNIVSVLPLTFTETPPWGRGRLAQWQAILEYFGNTPVGTGKTGIYSVITPLIYYMLCNCQTAELQFFSEISCNPETFAIFFLGLPFAKI